MSNSKEPLITIITVTYNADRYLSQTIESIISQTYKNIEYIVIDGGSTDGTLDIIKSYEEYISFWSSEPDDGIYDAMNRGILQATGDYIAFINADDWLESDAVELVADVGRDRDIGYIYGDLNQIRGDKCIGVHVADLSRYKQNTPIGHQSLFVRSDILKEMPFDMRYKIMSDYDSMIKLIKSGVSHHYIPKPLANFRKEGFSDISNPDRERFLIQYRHFGILRAIIGFIKETRREPISTIVTYLVKLKKRVSI
ncbi:glycosyl transferase, family 2 [hydrothermal vent metagenome]|uniref:Glycosyl transferase, family 2 n=1 Tax=hydrothermal vent metagenome TaxID=652676 RepID=A0A1W1BTA9_9ZZZZ